MNEQKIIFRAPNGKGFALPIPIVRGMVALAAALSLELGWAVDIAGVAHLMTDAIERGRLPAEISLGDRRLRRELLRRFREYRARGKQPPFISELDADATRIIHQAAAEEANYYGS